MIFSAIMLIVCSVSLVASMLVITNMKTEDYIDIGLWIVAILIVGILLSFISMIVGPRCAAEFSNKVFQMRLNPQNFSIQDASEVNKELINIAYWQKSIFTFHRYLDTTLLDLSKFVSI